MHRKQAQGKKSNSLLPILLLVMLVGIAFAGCSESGKAPTPPTPPAVSKPGTKPVSQATPTPIAIQPEYVYDAHGRKDPFAPLFIKETPGAKLSERPPLERYNIYDFKMTGIVWGGFGYNAMVEAPDGKGYFVHEGTIMGPNKGVVTKITHDRMIVEEKFKNFSGEIERKNIVIELRKKQEGMQ